MLNDNAVEFLSRFTEIEDLELLNVLDELPSLSPGGPWLAGGAIRRTLIGMELESDFDFFFKNAEQLSLFRKGIEKIGANKINENEHAETYMKRINGKDRLIQIVKMDFYDSPETLLDSFDFSITQLAYDGTDFYFGKYTLWDLPRKKLTLHKLTYGVATMRRLIKYTQQGFTACAGTMKAILEAVVDNPEVIQSDVKYVD
ncbi:hypothetical protein UY416_09570 [Paenibacillus polymyxa]|uniref:hypothetical protein n=1 Tax=Paenibacillus polymyxa TaxID=1406 RepID=UPI002AB54E09|nr:hypothetical protein [Paenibacillus polymyxa]MDY8046541.1 hypothetical protein [Paenibacillus polymyxa]